MRSQFVVTIVSTPSGKVQLDNWKYSAASSRPMIVSANHLAARDIARANANDKVIWHQAQEARLRFRSVRSSVSQYHRCAALSKPRLTKIATTVTVEVTSVITP